MVSSVNATPKAQYLSGSVSYDVYIFKIRTLAGCDPKNEVKSKKCPHKKQSCHITCFPRPPTLLQRHVDFYVRHTCYCDIFHVSSESIQRVLELKQVEMLQFQCDCRFFGCWLAIIMSPYWLYSGVRRCRRRRRRL